MEGAVNSTAKPSVMLTKLYFRLLPIQILIAVVGSINGIVSTLFASNYVGAEAMSAVGLYGPINLFIGAVSTLLFGGSQLLAGEYMGKSQVRHTQNAFTLDLILSTAFGLVISLLLVLAGLTNGARLFTKNEAVGGILNQYLLGQAIGVLPMVLGQQLSAFLSLEHQNKRTTVASIVFIIVNLILNYVFVYLLKMSAFGLSLASSLGMWVFFLVQFQHYLSGKSSLKISPKGVHWNDTGKIVRIGLPTALNTGYQAVRGVIVNAVIVKYVGELGLSAFSAANTMLGFAWAIPGAMLAVSRMLMSISVGEEDRQSLRDEIKIMFTRCIPLMAVVCAAIILLSGTLAGFYFQDRSSDVYQMTKAGFMILPLCMPLSIISMHFTCYGQLSGKDILIHVANAFDGFISVSFFTWLLTPAIGIKGVYVANVINGIVTLIIFVGYSVLKNKRFPKNTDDLLVVPAAFGVPENERMDLTVTKLDEVVKVAEEVHQFCLDRGIDEKRAYLAGLSMEEMAGNIIEHGYTKDKKQHSVDVRVIHKDDEMILRLKDDCVPFDPKERSEIVDPEDITKNIGIRMIYRLASDIKYQNILGLNVLMIKV